MRLPVILQRAERPFLCAHGVLEFLIQTIHPGAVIASQCGGLLLADFRDVPEMMLNLFEQPVAVIAIVWHTRTHASGVPLPSTAFAEPG